ASGSWIQSVQSNANRVVFLSRNTREELSRTLDPLPAPETGLVLTGRRDEILMLKDRRLDCEVIQYAGADDEPSRWISLTIWKAQGITLPPREVWTSPK